MDGKILNIVLAAGMAVLAATTIVTALSAQKREKQLLSVIESLKNSPGSEKTPEASETEPEKKTFTYLALGNSITKHGKCGYWWNECGMAASTAEKDYFHLVKAHLETEHDNVNATAYNFSAWEITAADRAQTLLTLEGYLSAKPDLITVQLSENVTDMTDFSGDFAYMLDWLAEKCPEAEIIVIDEFWLRRNPTSSAVFVQRRRLRLPIFRKYAERRSIRAAWARSFTVTTGRRIR